MSLLISSLLWTKGITAVRILESLGDVPFTEKSSKKFIQNIKRIAKQLKPTAEVLAISRSLRMVGHFFYNKDEIKRDMQSNIVYQLNCSSYQATYIGKTIRQIHRRLEAEMQLERFFQGRYLY